MSGSRRWVGRSSLIAVERAPAHRHASRSASFPRSRRPATRPPTGVGGSRSRPTCVRPVRAHLRSRLPECREVSRAVAEDTMMRVAMTEVALTAEEPSRSCSPARLRGRRRRRLAHECTDERRAGPDRRWWWTRGSECPDCIVGARGVQPRRGSEVPVVQAGVPLLGRSRNCHRQLQERQVAGTHAGRTRRVNDAGARFWSSMAPARVAAPNRDGVSAATNQDPLLTIE